MAQGGPIRKASAEIGVSSDSIKIWLHKLNPSKYKEIWGNRAPPYVSLTTKVTSKPLPVPRMITIEPPTLDDQKKRMALSMLENCMHLLKNVRELLE